MNLNIRARVSCRADGRGSGPPGSRVACQRPLVGLGRQQVPSRPDTPTYRLQVKTRSRVCIHALPCVLQPRTQPPCQDGLPRSYVSYGSRPHLPAEMGSSAATCPMALDLDNLPRRAPALSCVIWLWASPPYRGGL
jgi:hypothetical protein